MNPNSKTVCKGELRDVTLTKRKARDGENSARIYCRKNRISQYLGEGGHQRLKVTNLHSLSVKSLSSTLIVGFYSATHSTVEMPTSAHSYVWIWGWINPRHQTCVKMERLTSGGDVIWPSVSDDDDQIRTLSQ